MDFIHVFTLLVKTYVKLSELPVFVLGIFKNRPIVGRRRNAHVTSAKKPQI